ncbi:MULTISPECIES: hypothetical protein [unclassified Bradyrhizobium]|uniref:hypothetical protein n=1 Tax=unclassified Bradyrhizobium TaxID=2631580 RepID=UPI0033988452
MLGMIGKLFMSGATGGVSLQAIAIALAVAFAAGGTSTGIVVSKFYTAADEKEQIVRLEKQIEARDAAAAANSKALAETKGKLDVLDRVTNDLKRKVSDGDCFVDDDVDAVLDLLGQSKSAASSGRH